MDGFTPCQPSISMPNFALGGERGKTDFEFRKLCDRNAIDRCTGKGISCNCRAPIFTKEVIKQETSVNLLWIGANQCKPPSKTAAEAFRDEGIPVERRLVGEYNVALAGIDALRPIREVLLSDVPYLG